MHFIGVGGSGMSAVAHLWASRGAQVTGSDRKRSAYFDALEASGADVRVGEDPALVDHAEVVVISTAVRETNPELMRARQKGIAIWHRSEALAAALDGKTLAAVAGSHGKTTTSAMVATALHGSGVDASFAVGARVFGVEGAVAGGYAGSSTVAVVEADESDGSFLRYHPTVGIVTNVEADHFDRYQDLDALHAAFVEFASSSGLVIVCGDDPGARAVGEAARALGSTVITYGADTSRDPDVLVTEDAVVRAGQSYRLSLPLPGAHNRLNAAAAWACAVELGADPDRAAVALARFAGTGRRFQLRGEAASVRVIDDYAHHPTEVAALLAAARGAGAGHLVIVFQPALFTRTQALAREFGAALSIANADVIIAPVHGDREDPIPGVSSALIARAITVQEGQTVHEPLSLEDAAERAAELARPGSVVLTVGSGTVTHAAGWILDALERKDAQGSDHGVSRA
jgi:UDP-N-acetylmuramate--alanine ligase